MWKKEKYKIEIEPTNDSVHSMRTQPKQEREREKGQQWMNQGDNNLFWKKNKIQCTIASDGMKIGHKTFETLEQQSEWIVCSFGHSQTLT